MIHAVDASRHGSTAEVRQCATSECGAKPKMATPVLGLDALRDPLEHVVALAWRLASLSLSRLVMDRCGQTPLHRQQGIDVVCTSASFVHRKPVFLVAQNLGALIHSDGRVGKHGDNTRMMVLSLIRPQAFSLSIFCHFAQHWQRCRSCPLVLRSTACAQLNRLGDQRRIPHGGSG